MNAANFPSVEFSSPELAFVAVVIVVVVVVIVFTFSFCCSFSGGGGGGNLFCFCYCCCFQCAAQHFKIAAQIPDALHRFVVVVVVVVFNV